MSVRTQELQGKRIGYLSSISTQHSIPPQGAPMPTPMSLFRGATLPAVIWALPHSFAQVYLQDMPVVSSGPCGIKTVCVT